MCLLFNNALASGTSVVPGYLCSLDAGRLGRKPKEIKKRKKKKERKKHGSVASKY